jgi:hypothetical protein
VGALKVRSYLSSIDGVGAGKPLLAFFSTNSTKKGSSRSPAYRSSLQCKQIFDKAFTGNDYRVGFLAKYFALKKIDVTNVQASDNRAINNATAPTICLFDSKGALTSHMSGNIHPGTLASAMVATLRKSEIKCPNPMRVEALLKQMMTLESSKSGFEKSKQSLESQLALAKKTNNRMRIMQTEGKIADATRQLDVATKQLKKVRDALEAAETAN